MDRSELQKSTGISGIIDIRISIKKCLALPCMQSHKISLKYILVFSLISFKFRYLFINNPNTDIQSVGFFSSISKWNLKYIQGFVCFNCQKIILFQNIFSAMEYPERMVSENVSGSILFLLPETFFVVRVVAWSLSRYLTSCFDVSHVTT